MTSTYCVIDSYRTLNFSGISGTFATIGTPLAHQARLICVTNNTNGDMIFSTDGSSNQLFIPKNSFKLFDLTTNRQNNAPTFVIPPGTQFYVKQSTAATSGDVYVECIYGIGE